MNTKDTGEERSFMLKDPLVMDWHQGGANYLLAIGIDAYEHITPLTNCVRDTQDFVEVLQTEYGFTADHTITLYDAAATRSGILEAFESLSDTLTEQDNLLIYFAGHGYFKASNSIGCLAPVDADMKAIWTLIYNSVIRDYIRGIPAHHIFLVVDSCFSGDLILRSHEEEDLTRATEAYADRVDAKPSRWGLAAGRIEKVSDGIAGNNSPFNKALVTFLKTHNAHRFAVSELISHVSKITTYNADQTPIGGVLNKSGHQGGEFVFSRVGEGIPASPPVRRPMAQPGSSPTSSRQTLTKPKQAPQRSLPAPKMALYGGGILVLGLLAWFFSTQMGGTPSQALEDEFALTLIVKEEGEKPVRETIGKARVVIGDKDLGLKSLDEMGAITFTDISPQYLDSIVHLNFDQPVDILSPIAPTPRGGKRIEFVIKPKGTLVKGRVVDAQFRPVSKAILEFEGGEARDTTDISGNFSVRLPQAEGDKVQLRIRYQGEERFNRQETVSSRVLYDFELRDN